MNVRQRRISRRSIAIAALVAGTVSLAIGAHAALNMRTLDAAKAVATEQSADATRKVSRLALVIGNGHYPDANAPLTQPINDARALSDALRRNGFDVDMLEDASKDDIARAVDRLKAKIRPDFGGDAVLRRLRHSVRPRELHDPGRRHDLEGEPTSAATASASNRCWT